MARNKVFVSYSHKDKKWMNRLVNHLKVFELEGLLVVWVDKQIKGGQDWHELLHRAMLEARVAVLLVSNNFLRSEFIRKEEVPRLFNAHCADGMRIVPVIALPCTWDIVKWLARIQVLPENAEPLAQGNNIKVEKKLVKTAYDILDIYERWKPSPEQAQLCSEIFKSASSN
jgi:hypothetical protein